MAVRRIGWMAVFIVASLATPVRAQDEPRVGITMGYPASIGLIWHVADRVALRPEVSLSRGSGETTITTTVPVISVGAVPTVNTTTTVTTNTTDQWQVGIGVSALFYVTRHDALRTYVSPRYAYTRGSNSNQSSGLSPSTVSSSESTGHFVAGSFGAQYALGRRFSVFGEVGLGYTHTENEPTGTTSPGFSVGDSVSTTLSTRSGAGVILYF
jgi:hypothetical protein